MPIYEYKGQQYEMAETDPAVAKARILSYLGETVAPPAAPAPARTRASLADISEPAAPLGTDPSMQAGIASILAEAGGPKRSVLEGVRAPAPLPTEDPMLRPEFVQAVERQLGSLPAEQRKEALDKLAQQRDVYGRAARVVQGRMAAMDKATGVSPFAAGVTDPRLEAQVRKLITEGGMEAGAAEAYARQELAQGRIPRVLPKLERDIAGEQAAAAAAATAKELEDAGFTSRVGSEISSRLRQSALGAAQVYADITGDRDLQGDLMRYRRIESARGEAIPKGDSIFERSAQQAIATLGGQAPMILLSAITGTALPVLGQAAFDSFTQSYGEARSAGRTPAEAATRAGLMATAEVIFERFGLGDQLKAIRGAIDRIPTDQLAGYLTKSFAKEVPAEQGTTLANFLTDKLPQIGLQPDAGLKDYLEQAGETLRQTVLQSGASSATIYGAGKGIQALLGPRTPEEKFDVEALARSKGFLGGIPTAARAPAPAPAPAAPAPAPAAQERIEPTFDETAPTPAIAEGRIEPTLEGTPAAAPAPAPAPASDALLAALGIAPAPDRLAPGAPTPLSPEEIEAKVAQYAQFMPEEDARRTVMDEQRAASEAAEAKAAAPAPAPAAPPQLDETTQRLKDLTQERIDAGVPPQQAALQALEQLQKEAQADAEGEQRVAGTVAAPSGEGAGVAGVPGEQPAPGGLAGTERTGVVPTAEDAGQPAAGEGAKPGAVTGEAAPPAAPKTNEEILAAATDAELAKALTQYGGSEVGRLPPDLIQGEIAKRKAAAEAKPETKPAGKRGRKPLPPEERAKSDERRKEQRRESNAASREVARMEAELAEAKKPVEPGDYPNETEYTEGKISQGMRRKRILAALHDFARTNKNKPGQRAKELLEAEATAQEIADIAKGYDLRKQAARKISPTQKDESRAPDPVNIKFNAVSTGAQAISVLLRTGTLFQKFMAARIRNAVRNVNVVVLEKDDPLPAQLSTPMAKSYWDTARALYIYSDAEGKGTVYLRGESFGNDQGINNVTVLHELLHAATAQKIQLALRLIEKGVDLNSPAVKAVLDLRETMRAAADEFIRLNNAGRIPKDLADLYMTSRGAIFTDVREFVSYGLTDVGFQRFLNRVTDVVEPSETFFSRFVDAIRKLFGVPEGMHTAMTNLVLATDKVIASRKSDRMKMLEARDAQLAKIAGEKQRISAQDKRTLDEIDKEVDEALLKFQKSKTAEEAAENIGLLHSLRKWDDTKQYFKSIYDTVDAGRLNTLLSVVPTDVVADWGSSYIPEMKNTNNLLVDMRNMQYQLVTGASEVSESMTRAIAKDPSLFDKLARVMSVATDVRVDPATDPRNKTLNNLYIALGPEGQRVYTEVRDYYARMIQLYTSLLDAQIADANLPPDAKNKLMAQIRKKFETDKKIVPYFPFVRNRGTHWLRVKRTRGEAAEFYMLGSIAERDAVAAAIAKEMNRPVDELYKDEVFKAGDTVESLRRRGGTVDLSDSLKNIFNEIDNLASLGPKDKDQIKDSVYELYLMTMPEQSFRNSFIARKDVAGYSTDVVRAFSTSSLRFANQLPRIKYNQKLRNSILAGRESLKGNPDAAKLERFIGEMETRIGAELNPEIRRGTWESVVDFITRLAFIHYLSSAGSAILQGVGLLYGASTLGARHGYAQTALEMSKMLRVFGEYSIIKKNPDGSVSVKPPTVALSKRVATNPMEQRAIREVFGAVTEHTISSEVLGRGRVSTAKFEGRGSMVGRGFSTVVGGLFHTTERLVRETIFMSSFRLSMKEGQKKGLKGDELFNYAKQQAIADVYDSVGNMREENRPPMFRNATGRFLLQFLHYPLFITIRWMQEFKRMLPFMGNEAKFQAFKEFAGIMGTTYILGGAAALPFIKEMAGFIAAAFDDFDEEDKPADMRSMSYWTWWANVWLPEYMGKVGIFGKSLEEVTGMSKEDLAAFITRGPTNVLTGRDISSRVSINPTDMLLGGPTKETRTTRESAIELALERAGPAANMVLSYMDAYDAWQDGDMQKTMEKLLPAVARNVAIAEKYRKEGVKDFKGNELISKDNFTRGDYLYQLIGLRPDDLANHQKVLFEMSRGENKIRFERERIIRNAREAALKEDASRYQQAIKNQNAFNLRYPEYEIKDQDIERSIKMREQELTDSFKGFRFTEKNEAIFGPTASASGLALAKRRGEAEK